MTETHIVNLDVADHDTSSMIQAINNIKTESDDTFLFYYSGHGAYDFEKGVQLFTLENGNTISRLDIAKAIKSKNVRLKILLTDCCNIVRTEAIIKRPAIRKGAKNGIKKLFFESEGFVDITSSRICEASLTLKCEQQEIGSLFTNAFLLFVKENAHKSDVKWSDFSSEGQKKMTKFFKDMEGFIDLKEYLSEGYPEWLDKVQTDQRMYIHSCPGIPAYRFGASITRRSNDQIYINRILENTPAEKAGLKSGDRILKINGRTIKSLKMVDILIDMSPQNMEMTVESEDKESRSVTVKLTY